MENQKRFEAFLWAIPLWIGGIIFMALAAPPPPTATGLETVAYAVIYVIATGIVAAMFGAAMLLLINRYPKN